MIAIFAAGWVGLLLGYLFHALLFPSIQPYVICAKCEREYEDSRHIDELA